MQVQGLKKRSEGHTARRIWHLAGVLAIFLIYQSVPLFQAQVIICLGFIAFVPIDFIRLRVPTLNKTLIKFFSPIMRQSEVESPAGTSYLLAGVLILILVFPRPVTSLSLLFLALADPAASFVGIRYGRHKILGQKSLEGSLAAFVACLLATLFSFYGEPLNGSLIALSLAAALIGTLAELLPIGKLDDNLSLPLLSAAGLSLLFTLFGRITW